MQKPIIALVLSAFLLQGCAGALLAGGAAGAAMANHDRRSIGTQFDDQTIELKVMKQLSEKDELRGQSNISAVAFNGQLLLIGQASSEHLRSVAVNEVRQLPEARTVHNQIRVLTPTSLSTRTSDSWLTSKVKSKLLADRNIDGTRIKVVTENSEVFLMGLVTPAEAETAVDIARHTRGVKRVVKAFHYQ